MDESQTAVNESAVEAPQTETTAEPKSFIRELTESMRSETQKTEAERPKQPNQYTKRAESESPRPNDVSSQAVPVLPPADMSPEQKARFLKLAPDDQKYISERAYQTRSEYSRRMNEVSESAKRYENIERELAPNREYLAKKGVDEATVVRRAIAWEQAADRDRLGTAKEWLAAHGIDPFELIDDAEPQQQNGHSQQPQTMTPEQIEQIVEQRLQKQNEYSQQSYATLQNHSVVERFIADKPLFRDQATAHALEQEMAPLVEQYSQSMQPEQALQKAYDYVTRGNESFRNLLDSFSERERAEKARAEADKARASSRSLVSGGLGGANRASTGMSFGDELKLRLRGGM